MRLRRQRPTSLAARTAPTPCHPQLHGLFERRRGGFQRYRLSQPDLHRPALPSSGYHFASGSPPIILLEQRSVRSSALLPESPAQTHGTAARPQTAPCRPYPAYRLHSSPSPGSAPQAPSGPACHTPSGRSSPSSPPAPGWCRYSKSPSRAECAARASTASAQIRACHPYPSSRPQCVPASAAGTSPCTQSRRSTARRTSGHAKACASIDTISASAGGFTIPSDTASAIETISSAPFL